MKKIILLSKFILNKYLDQGTKQDLLLLISGGQDSIVLLLIFLHLQMVKQFTFKIIHFNHFWQKDNFYYSFELVKFAYLLNISIILGVPEIKITSETTGHYWRKRKICQIASFFERNAVVFGHTGSDQLETSLWHFLRGSSPKGLVSLKDRADWNTNKRFYNTNISSRKKQKSKFFNSYQIVWNLKKRQFSNKSFIKRDCLIKQSSIDKKIKSQNLYSFIFFVKKNITIYRPLLDLHRSDISSAILENELPIFIDITNQKIQFTKNKIRLVILPLLRYYFHTSIDLHLKKCLNMIYQNQNFFTDEIEEIILSYLVDSEMIFDYYKLNPLLQEYLLYYLLQIYTSNTIKNNLFQDFKYSIFSDS